MGAFYNQQIDKKSVIDITAFYSGYWREGRAPNSLPNGTMPDITMCEDTYTTTCTILSNDVIQYEGSDGGTLTITNRMVDKKNIVLLEVQKYNDDGGDKELLLAPVALLNRTYEE